MTEREKIAETIVQIRGYTVLQAAQIADTLIAAGIGDVEEAKRKAFVYSKELTHLDGILKGAELRAEVAEKEFKKAEHRAVVTERALLVACDDIKGLCRYLYEIEKITKAITIKCYHPEKIVPREYIVIAEKELAEEKKDANRI